MTPEERFSELLRVPTVSAAGEDGEDASAFAAFPALLQRLYPAVHRTLRLEKIGDRALLYAWEGENPDLLPVLGMAHWDVVPAGDPASWDDDPFGGRIEGGKIHGRGALDDKGMLAAWFEAAEALAARGFRPARTVYLSFGGDEETTGARGAARVAARFAGEGVRFSFVLDEGGAVAVDQMSDFTDDPVALVGTAEKGYLTVELRSAGKAGHASSPPKETVVGRLSRAVAALESSPFPKRLTPSPAGMLRVLGAGTGGAKGFVLRHPRLFAPVLLGILGRSSRTAGMVRTTVAPTMLRAGERENVLPEEASATVNIRILPGESVASVLERLAGVVGPGVDIVPLEGSVFEPVEDSPASGPPWELFARLVERHWPGALCSPYLMTATTDSRHFRDLSDRIYRFIPMEVGQEEMNGVHAPNERISLDAWKKGIAFLTGLFESLDYED